MNYPSDFFAPFATPTFSAASVVSMVATPSAPAPTHIVITTGGASIGSGTPVVITLSGFTMGAATAGSATGITVQTDADTTASAGVDSGTISSATAQSSQVTAVTFSIATADRVASKSAVSVTLGFKTNFVLPVAGKITLNYPAGFFASSTAPSFAAGDSSVATMTGAVAVPTATQIVITTSTAGIAAGTIFTITLRGLTMGAATAGSATGITVQTDADTTASAGVASGAIGGQATISSWTVTSAYRVPGQSAVAGFLGGNAVTVVFTTSAFTETANAITINFPTGFFVAGAGVPVVACTGGIPTPTATVAALSLPATQFVLTLTSAWDASAKTCVFSNIASSATPTLGAVEVSVSTN
jgi:hypothetical protein